MLVADLHHFLDLDEDVPAPARRLAAHLAAIVRAAASGDANASWGGRVGNARVAEGSSVQAVAR